MFLSRFAFLKYNPRPVDGAMHGLLLGGCLLLVALPFIFNYRPGNPDVRVGRFSLPALCASRTVLNTDCPGCGLTRSFISLAHGKLSDALRLHRLAPALYLYFLLQIGFRLWMLLGNPSPWRDRASRINHYLGWALIAALLSNWIVGLALGIGN